MACDTSGAFKLEMVNDMAVKTGTKQTFLCTADKATQYTVYDYKFNITGDVTMTYNNHSELIVTLENGFIQAAGSGVWPRQRPFEAPWYGSLAGPLPCWRSIAMAVSTSPDIPNSGWKKCLGGWYAAGTNCNTTCPKDKNPPGGTWYWFSDTQAGTKWDKSQHQHGGRKLETLTWNLGEIQSENGIDLKLYMFARAEQACQWNQPDCNTIPFAPSSIPRVELTAPVCPFEAPVLSRVRQSPDICKNCVDVTLDFAQAQVGDREGVLLVVDYKYSNEPWDESMYTSKEVGVSDGDSISLPLGCLIPNREVCWRAKHITTMGETAESDYVEGCFTTEFVPPVWMEVPPISVAECTRLANGRPLPEFTYITNYYGERL